MVATGRKVPPHARRPSYIAAEPLHEAWPALESDAGDVFTLGQVVVMADYASHAREMLSFAKLVDVPGGSDGILTRRGGRKHRSPGRPP